MSIAPICRRPLARTLRTSAVLALGALLGQCTTLPENAAEPDWILVAGERVPIGTRVVTWSEPGGYSAYRRGKHFDRSQPPDGEARYAKRRPLLDDDDITLADLQREVRQFVLHYDMAGTSRQCFKVLQDVRNLSVHFLLDVDGTIYQTLDVQERAWHATVANDRAVGVEIAHPGAYPQPMSAPMRRWYDKDEQGYFMVLPKWIKESGVRTPNFVARPVRPEVVSGFVQTRTYHQLDFTREQYEALAHLCAGLNRALPRIALAVPRNGDGEVVDRALPPEQLGAFEGILGHYHVQTNKQDPGPAFQWERVLHRARALREDGPPHP